MRRTGLLLLGALVLQGCPERETKAAPKPCVELYAQCQLPDGPLGVCSDVPCPPGKAGPCLKCTPQH